MAGRQKHNKRTYDLTSPVRYKGKMYALFKPYMGKDYAKQLAEVMLKEYESTSVAYYTKVRDSEALRTYLDANVGSAKQFMVFQLVNEFISSVLLTRNETASMVYYKYTSQGLPSDVVRNVMAITTNVLGNDIPQLVAYLGGEGVDPANVINKIDNYVISTPPAPRSYGGKLSAKQHVVIPAGYAGTRGFSGYEAVTEALEEIKEQLSQLA